MSIGQNIKKAMAELNIEPIELSEQSGIHIRTVRDIINDKVDTSVSKIKKIIISLGVSADVILFNDHEQGENTDLSILYRELEKFKGEDREYAKKVIKGILIHHRSQKLLSK